MAMDTDTDEGPHFLLGSRRTCCRIRGVVPCCTSTLMGHFIRTMCSVGKASGRMSRLRPDTWCLNTPRCLSTA